MSVEAAEVQNQCPTCQFHYSNEDVSATFVSTDWRTPFLEYLLEGILPSNSKDVYRLKRLALRYFMEGGTLFRKGFHGEPLRCLSPSESQMVMKETHARVMRGASREEETLPIFTHIWLLLAYNEEGCGRFCENLSYLLNPSQLDPYSSN
jgi:hypothetical protein